MKAVDVMGFAGSFAAGVDQAGFDIIAKREPAKFKGFGMDSMLYNMPWVEGQLADPEDWDLPADRVELVYGCPPCSGFSQLSHANTLIHNAVVGPEAEINECMVWLVDYAARVRPSVVILESVGVAFKSGREWMEGLWERLRERSGVDYYLTHVNMNASLVGGDVIRPRYFLVAHTEPFGVGLEFVRPRTAAEVLADLPAQTDDSDEDWGHMLKRGSGIQRWLKTMEYLKEHGRTWRPGTRLPDNNEGLEPPEFWLRKDNRRTERMDKVLGADHPSVYSHWYSTDPFSTYRWHPDRPYGVVVAAVLDRAIHPVHDRPLTWREAARFMSIPDDWSMASMVRRQAAGELGKAVPSASGKWIAHWARMSIEGTPGEFAGVAQSDERVRVIQVQNEAQVKALIDQPPVGAFWTEPFADPTPARWLIDRRARPVVWRQRDQQEPPEKAPPVARRARRTPVQGASRTAKTPVASPDGTIRRVPPEDVMSYIESLGIDKKEAARRLGVSYSRVNELTGHSRPKSWLNVDRWDDVKEKLKDA
jgi:site-specific DNA-cytosine methylase